MDVLGFRPVVDNTAVVFHTNFRLIPACSAVRSITYNGCLEAFMPVSLASPLTLLVLNSNYSNIK